MLDGGKSSRLNKTNENNILITQTIRKEKAAWFRRVFYLALPSPTLQTAKSILVATWRP
jgi:hypothetical protein